MIWAWIRAQLRTLSPFGWMCAAAVIFALLLATWLAAAIMHDNARDAAADKVTVALDRSHQASAADAIETTVQAGARDAATDATTLGNRDAIYHAPGADQRLDPGLNRAGAVSLCRYSAYRGRPECVQHAHPVQP